MKRDIGLQDIRNGAYSRRTVCVLLMIFFTLITSSCRETPETDIIVNKEGQGSLVSNHAQADQGISLRDQLQAPEQVEAEGITSNDFTSIHVNANVVIPDQTAVPVYSFVPRQFEEAELQTITEIFFNDGGVTNWNYAFSQYSEEELYDNIERLQHALSFITITDVETPVLNDDGYVVECNQEYYNMIESMKTDYERQLSEVQKIEMNPTPTYSFSEYQDRRLAPMVIDGEYQPTDDMEALNWADVTVREFGAQGRRNGILSIMRISEDLNNTVLEYHIDPKTTMKNGGTFYDLDIRTTSHSEYRDNMCIYSLEEAEKMVTDLLQELGMDGFTAEYVYDLNVRNNMNGYDTSETVNGYSMILLRGYDGMNEIYDSYSGSEMIYSEFIETPMYWNRYPLMGLWNIECRISEEYGRPTVNRYKEMCMATVMDDGIVKFVLLNPMQEQEQLAEHVELLECDQALDCGIRQLEKKWGESGTSHTDYSRVDVRSIQLNYAYMQNPNAPNEYTMIPVWDFRGGVNGGVYVTINAIDGSAFERALMY